MIEGYMVIVKHGFVLEFVYYFSICASTVDSKVLLVNVEPVRDCVGHSLKATDFNKELLSRKDTCIGRGVEVESCSLWQSCCSNKAC